MEEPKDVILYGMWASPFARWVKVALNIKGISYQYVEESMKKKSQLLLKYNPIYKKVPVLVHNGNPIVESLVILQYIDETWKASPRLLPSDPYSKSIMRFWADFITNKLEPSLRKVVTSQGIIEEEEESILELQKNLNTLEYNIKAIFPNDSPPICAEDMRMLDILLCWLPSVINAIEEAFKLKLMEPQKYPLTWSRMASLCSFKVVKDTAPPHEKLVRFYRGYRRYYTFTPIHK